MLILSVKNSFGISIDCNCEYSDEIDSNGNFPSITFIDKIVDTFILFWVIILAYVYPVSWF